MVHFKTGQADRDIVRADGEIVFVFEFHATLFVECDKGNDVLPAAVLVDRQSVMGGVKEQLGNHVLRQKRLHGEEAVKEPVEIMAAGRLEQWKHRQVVFRIGGREHIEVIPVVKTAPGCCNYTYI